MQALLLGKLIFDLPSHPQKNLLEPQGVVGATKELKEVYRLSAQKVGRAEMHSS